MTGELLPRPHQDHSVLRSPGVLAELHQRGARIHHRAPQRVNQQRLLRSPARTHALRLQHVDAAVHLNTTPATRRHITATG